MGEIAEMILEGILCEGCGEALDDMMGGAEAPGYPRRCAGCDMSPRTQRSVRRVVTREREAARHDRERHEAAKARKPHACDICDRLFRSPGGVAQHKRDKHPTHPKVDPANPF